VLIGCAISLGCQAPVQQHKAQVSIGVIEQEDAHTPLPWRQLVDTEQTVFDLGHAVFNTQWVPANSPAGRRDGLGPLFNSQSCDACHNSRRRGRGPRGEGEAPSDLVIQLGQRLPDGSIQRSTEEYGRVLNTSAIQGFVPEASVTIHYEQQIRTLADGTRVSLRMPHYRVDKLSGPALPIATILMPRMPPLVHGVGLLELVPQSEIVALSKLSRHDRGVTQGHVSWIDTDQGKVIGRFGWQATEPSVATQTAGAFSRDMGLTTSLISHIDCGKRDERCQTASNGGAPEVEPELFDAVVRFQQLEAVPREKIVAPTSAGEHLFDLIGCSSCHRSTLPLTAKTQSSDVIHPYTDLLLHDMGLGLADRGLDDNPVHSEWRTAPLWGLQVSVNSGQPLRLLHDGRATTIEEAILWHDGAARDSSEQYARLTASDRQALTDWIATR
jgi:CxxC motif-containing protein (DUF1111 family)